MAFDTLTGLCHIEAMKQISYAEARLIAIRQSRVSDPDFQVRNLAFEQRSTGIQATFQHYNTGKFRRTFIKGCYLPDRPDPSLSPEEYKKAKAAFNWPPKRIPSHDLLSHLENLSK